MKIVQSMGLVLAYFCISFLASSAAKAATVTFENLDIDLLINAGVQTEGTIEYQATVGNGWELVNSSGSKGNPPSALATFFNDEGALVGDRVEFELVGGGAFEFISVDTRANGNPATSDLVQLIGTLNGNPVGILSPSSTSGITTSFGFAGAIDKLTVEVTMAGSNAFWVDNLVLAAVPEPTTLGLALFGLIGLGVRRRSNR